ncbi:MAG: phosphopantothenoylcysteine decarboxylase [Candidatus Omnitrophica bacterium]|nr:phosphopantothenoylcysteine decarboxylase [Candidatus Omnitrophota bacterium]
MKILVTAGATWVKIDDVRVITNIFTGRTGLALAEHFKKRKHKVTLLINPARISRQELKGFTVVPYFYYDEFKREVESQLKNKQFDLIVHTAAVSDYKLKKSYSGKISSGKKKFSLDFRPTEKIVKIIRKLARTSILVQFKLEPTAKGLIDKAYLSLKQNNADYVVANALSDLSHGYKSYIIDKDKKIKVLNSKAALARFLSEKSSFL